MIIFNLMGQPRSQDIQPLIDYISSHIDLDPSEIDLIAHSVQHRRFLKGQYVVQHGSVCKNESFVLKGCLKTFYLDRDGNEHVVMFAVENWWTADLGSFITQSPANYNVQCLEDCQLIQINYQSLQKLYHQIPKLERFFRIIIQKAYVASEKRIIRNFSLPARDRYLAFRKQYPQIEQRVPQYLIASYLGITKEFLSKIRSQLNSID